jgi:hypothetical protein
MVQATLVSSIPHDSSIRSDFDGNSAHRADEDFRPIEDDRSRATSQTGTDIAHQGSRCRRDSIQRSWKESESIVSRYKAWYK